VRHPNRVLDSGPVTQFRKLGGVALTVIRRTNYGNPQHTSAKDTSTQHASSQHACTSEPLRRTRESLELHLLRRDFHQ